MHYSTIKDCDIANGIGVRITLFVSGCTNHCKNCFQPQTWDFDFGEPFTEETEEKLLEMLKPDYINGLTLLGGEPMEPENRPTVLALVKEVRTRYPEKDIWCYTGYTFDKDLLTWISRGQDEVAELLACIDVLVDGEFIEEQKNLRLPFRGSENQRIIDVQASLKQNRVILKAIS